MADASDLRQRVKFYGPQDLSAGWHAPRVVQIAEKFSAAAAPTDVNYILEIYNVQQYLEHRLIPKNIDSARYNKLIEKIPKMMQTVARYFTEIVDDTLATKVAGVSHMFHGDLVELLGRYGAFERCRASVTLSALSAVNVDLRTLLTSKKLVRQYDREIRDAILGSPVNAEYLIEKHLQRRDSSSIYAPRSLSAGDIGRLLDSYVDSDDPNINYLRLIATARTNTSLGIDARLKLKAKRRSIALESDLFAGAGIKVGWEIGIFDGQVQAAQTEIDDSDGLTFRYRYSRDWLEASLDYPSVLNNFIYLFDFVDEQSILTLPYYSSRQGVLERLIGVTGVSEYRVSPSSQVVDNATQVQMAFYMNYLATKQLDLENMISWFFQEYIVEQYGAEGFTFTPSDVGASYLPRVRHLFAEMESVAAQFSMFASDGMVDRELLAIAAEPIRYKEIPTLVAQNYAYATEHEDIAKVMHLLFSDQSELAFIDTSKNDHSAAQLIATNDLTYSDFREDQRPAIDYLAELGILQRKEDRISFANYSLLRLLLQLFNNQAISFYHLSIEAREALGSLIEKGWIARRGSLLTEPEADFFNFKLNAVDFTNGPQIRNKYQHGAQSNTGGENAHYDAYVTALKLTVALVIKINDNFCQVSSEASEDKEWPGADINFCLEK